MTAANPLTSIAIRDAMTTHVQSMMPDDTLEDAVALMVDHQLSTIPIVDSSNRCVGILSRNDLTELFLKEDHALANVLDTDRLSMDWINRSMETCEVRLVKELMTIDVTVARDDQSLVTACQTMAAQKIHHLPVVDDAGQVVGMLSAYDVVRSVANA